MEGSFGLFGTGETLLTTTDANWHTALAYTAIVPGLRHIYVANGGAAALWFRIGAAGASVYVAGNSAILLDGVNIDGDVSFKRAGSADVADAFIAVF